MNPCIHSVPLAAKRKQKSPEVLQCRIYCNQKYESSAASAIAKIWSLVKLEVNV